MTGGCPCACSRQPNRGKRDRAFDAQQSARTEVDDRQQRYVDLLADNESVDAFTIR
jgi:hypothetical protein